MTTNGVHASAILALGVALHYLWSAFPPDMQAQVWNASGAIARSVLLLALVWHVRSRAVLMVAAWWLAEESMVAGCSVAYMIAPWHVPPGASQCSALLQFDIGRIGLAVVALILMLIPSRR